MLRAARDSHVSAAVWADGRRPRPYGGDRRERGAGRRCARRRHGATTGGCHPRHEAVRRRAHGLVSWRHVDTSTHRAPEPLRARRRRGRAAPPRAALLRPRPARPASPAAVRGGAAAARRASHDVHRRDVRRTGPIHARARVRAPHRRPPRATDHRGPQRERFVELYLAALDEAGLPDDEPFRAAVREHVEFGTRVAMQNSNATSDDELHPLREVPHWTWPDEQ